MFHVLRIAAIGVFIATCGLGFVFGAEIPLEDVEIHLNRGGCYGTCPIYSVSIHGDGTVVFEGKRYVSHLGPAEGQVTTDEVVELVNKFLAAHFFSALPEYRNKEVVQIGRNGGLQVLSTSITDMERVTLSFKLGDREHSVFLYCFYPLDLKYLALSVDELANTRQWIEGEEE